MMSSGAPNIWRSEKRFPHFVPWISFSFIFPIVSNEFKKKRTSNAHLHHLPWLNTHIPTIHTIAIHTIPAMPFCAWDESGVSSCWWCAPSQNHRHRRCLEALDLVENGCSYYWSFNKYFFLKKKTINSLALLSNWMVEVDWTVAISWFILHPLLLNNASDCPTTKRIHQVCSLFATLFSHLAELITTESQTKVWNVRGMFTPSRLCWNLSLSFKFFRLLGHVTPSRLWLNHWPNCKFSRLSGKITWSKLQLKRPPKDRLWRLLGKVTPSRYRLNSSPKVKLWRLAGKVTCWRHWLNI